MSAQLNDVVSMNKKGLLFLFTAYSCIGKKGPFDQDIYDCLHLCMWQALYTLHSTMHFFNETRTHDPGFAMVPCFTVYNIIYYFAV